jgi:L-fuculose-phosphate aldolase
MKKLISARDVEEMMRKGEDLRTIPTDALLTPSARDMVRDALDKPRRSAASAPAPSAPLAAPSAPSKFSGNISAKSSKSELEAFYYSPEIQKHKEEICELGRRLWQREYVDGNGGNFAIRVRDDVVLCTPTMVSKGFMKPDDMCLVDLEGNQLFGAKKRTSEALMHLQMMKRQPRAFATVHCHPPYATAFAVAGVEPPTCLLPEFEVFCAVAIAPYRTPGTPEMGKLVADLVDKYNTILMANHGVVSWSHNSVEEAYWRMEIVEAYCRTILVATQLGKRLETFSPAQMQDLLKIKQSLGYPDPRIGLKECELCDNSDWRPGVTCQVPSPSPEVTQDPDAERLVQAVTEQLMQKLGKG